MGRRRIAVIVAVIVAVGATAACGRLGFDDRSSSPVADAPPPPLTALACDQPMSNTSTVSTMADQLTMAVTNDQVVALSSDNSDFARAWTFSIADTGALVPAAVGAPVASDCTGTLAVANLGTGADGVLAGWSNSSGGMDLQQLSAAGTAIGSETHNGSAPVFGAMAASGLDGTLALVTYGAFGEIDAVTTDATGAAIGAAVTLLGSAVGAGDVEIATSASGYALTWNDPRPSPNAKMVELLAPDFSVVAGPVTASTGMFDAEDGQVAWSPQSSTYLVSWNDKNITDDDEINIRVFDASLTPIAASSTVIAAETSDPRIASDDAGGYWVVGGGYAPNAVVVEHVAADGSVTSLPPIPTSPLAWALGVRAGQPVVTWLVQNALWVDAPCAN